MAISSTTDASSALSSVTDTSKVNPNGILGKDDFLKLLLVELQYQDPTEPTDTEKILSQTSQLAALESADNTNKALEKLSASLSSSQQFSTISAIGKMADLGSNSIAHEESENTTFEIYFSKDVTEGEVKITDNEGAVVATIDVGEQAAGVHQFTWDGRDLGGNSAKSGVYSINASYNDKDGNAQTTKLGAYPIESVRFDGGNTLVKVGSNYVPLENIKEVY